MIVGVADTHAALWFLLKDPRHSSAVKSFLHNASLERQKIAISSITLVEIVYLMEKGRIPVVAYELTGAIADPNHIFIEAPVYIAIVNTLRLVSRTEVPDMPDRIVAATGIHFSVPVLSRDRRIRSTNLSTLW